MQILSFAHLSASVGQHAGVNEPGEGGIAHTHRLGRWRPAPHQLAVAGIGGLALLSYTWNLGSTGYATYYSAAARSMASSWRAFWFGSFDPGAHITLDKLSGFLIPQALSARIFGFHPWALALPQAIEGVVTVLAVYLIGRRWRGIAVGLLGAVAATVTPVFASMFGHVMEDGLLTMCLALAVVCWQSALRRFRIRSVVFAGLWVGLGFQAKMLSAWVLLPPLVIGLLLVAGWTRRRRLWSAAALTATAVASSLAWLSVIQLIPAGRRPVVDGTSNNNMFAMVFGYNGINRLSPHFIGGVLSGNPAKGRTPVLALATRARKHLPAHLVPNGLEHAKLVLPYYASQIGWLYPAAAVGLVLELGVLVRLHRLRGDEPALDDPVAAATDAGFAAAEVTTLALLGWLVLAAALLTVSRVPHVAYLATIGVQLALFAAAGLAALARRYRADVAVLALPALVLVSAAWAGYVIWRGDAAPPALGWVVVCSAAVVTAFCLLGRRKFGRIAVALALVSVLLAPAAWTSYVFDRATSGNAGEAYAGPRPGSHTAFRLSHPFRAVADPAPSNSQQAFLQYLADQHARGSTVLTDNWTIAAGYLLVTRLNVLSMGGFSGRAPTPSLAQVQRLIDSGRIKFALLTKGYPAHNVSSSLVGQNDIWVRSHCSLRSQFDLVDRYSSPPRPIQVYRCGSAT